MKLSDEEGSKSVTDDKVLAFFENINKIREKESRHEVRTFNDKKTKNIELSSRIVSEDVSPMLSFKIGLIGSKKYILKDIFLLQQAVENEKKFVLGKKEFLNFASQDFTEQREKLASTLSGAISRAVIECSYSLNLFQCSSCWRRICKMKVSNTARLLM